MQIYKLNYKNKIKQYKIYEVILLLCMKNFGNRKYT